MKTASERPLVSIFMFCKDRADTIRRSIESVLSQSYPNIEYIVQDGASTDGTLEVLESYGDRINLISEPDSGPAEGFWRALNRCRGDIIGSCASDEEYLPCVVERAVNRMQNEPHLGAITCDGFMTDIHGTVVSTFKSADFNIIDYLFSAYSPFWPGSFFRRSALLDIGLGDHESWTIECLEFDIWCRLGTRYEVKHFPDIVSKYAFHEGQLSNTPHNYHEHLNGRMRVIKKMFSGGGFFGENDDLKALCMISQYMLFHYHVKALGLDQEVDRLRKEIFKLKNSGAVLTQGSSSAYRIAAKIYEYGAVMTPARIRNAISRGNKDKIRKLVFKYFIPCIKFIRRQPPYEPNWTKEEMGLPAIENAHLYLTAATIYNNRGQIEQSLKMWSAAEALGDATAGRLICQNILKLPAVTDARVLQVQREWAEGHAQPVPDLAAFSFTPPNNRRIRVGYACSFWNGTALNQIIPFIAAHDREEFEIFGYSPTSEPPFITNAFDGFSVIGKLSDREYVEQIRSDGIDVLVELSGYSSGHRFSAMASRCAPVQISTFNHTGTTGTPNIDYVLTDKISAPSTLDIHFTETIWRLDECWLCCWYDQTTLPEISNPPHLANGHITFGCFGSGSKLNDDWVALVAKSMHAVERSRIFIRNNELTPESNRELMLNRFERCGIAPERVMLRSGTDRMTILNNYAEVDISLDTWPYCGGNTIFESLWQGVPVLSLMGGRITSRYGGSILHASGLADLAVETEDDFVRATATLAADPDRLKHLRHNLRQMTYDHGSSNVKAFARNLEVAYRDMLRKKFS